jgi:hypothetical protein
MTRFPAREFSLSNTSMEKQGTKAQLAAPKSGGAASGLPLSNYLLFTGLAPCQTQQTEAGQEHCVGLRLGDSSNVDVVKLMHV